VIGWISFSEVFLLGVVVLLATALFLEVRVIRGKNKTRELSDKLDTVMDRGRSLTERIRALEVELRLAQVEQRRHRAEAEKLAETVKRLNGELAVLKEPLSLLREKEEELWLAQIGERRHKAEAEKLAETVKRLNGEIAALKDGLRLAQNEERRRKTEAVEQGKTIEQLNDELATLKKDLALSASKYEEILKVIKDAEDRILRPLDSAKLVVTLSCKKLPDGLDLDLYVQDPDDQLCYWKQPRVLTADSETGMLIPSEDLRARANQTVEIFYSNRLLSKDPNHPYLVFAMLRTTGSIEAIEPVEIIWEIKARKGAELVVLGQGTKRLSQAGRVVVRDRLYVYSGLNPLCSFEVPGPATSDQTVQMRSDVPNLLRGWETSSIPEGSTDFNRIRDRSP
jgi:predicted  nucleic acid-binding Zn-ribbon protein